MMCAKVDGRVGTTTRFCRCWCSGQTEQRDDRRRAEVRTAHSSPQAALGSYSAGGGRLSELPKVGWKGLYLNRSYQGKPKASSHFREIKTARSSSPHTQTVEVSGLILTEKPKLTIMVNGCHKPEVSAPRRCLGQMLQADVSRNLPSESNIWNQASLQHQVIWY